MGACAVVYTHTINRDGITATTDTNSMSIPGHRFNNRFSDFDHTCTECNLFVCNCNAS